MIYGLMDFELLQKYALSFENYIDRCKELDVAIIQYRDKISSFEEVKKNLLQIRKLWDKTLIINDYIDLVEFVDGVHIGQEDLKKYGSIANIRDKIARKLLGLSTHNKDEILKANQLDIDYIGLGAYRETTTKDVLSIGGKKLENLAKLSIHPVAMIGGVKLDDEIKNISYKVIGSDICKSISIQ
jgi:thiamine-phosphate pyrophosphorylase